MNGGKAFDRVLQMIRKRPANRHVFAFCSEIESLEIHDAQLFSADVLRSVAEDMASILLGHPPRASLHPLLATDDIDHLLPPGEDVRFLRTAPCDDPASVRVFGKRPRDEILRKHTAVLAEITSSAGARTQLYMCSKGTQHARGDIAALSLLRNPARRIRELCGEVVEFASAANAPRLANSMLVVGLANQLLREIQSARVRLRAHTVKK